jgi:protocatechuate 3,4-dioxygenase beta subunit
MIELDRRSVISGFTLLGGMGIVTACRAATVAGSSVNQVRPDLYACEGCEAVAERDAGSLPSTLRLASLDEPGERMLLSGRVMSTDGSRPVGGVVIYAHHTNAQGHYANGTPETEWSRRHGRLRGWVRTDAEGRYAFDTIKPAPYPDNTEPAHVHLFIKEVDHPPYYLDDVVFEGEIGVTPAYRARQGLRGGDGVIRLSRDPDGRWLARRDIRLERHSI